MANAGYGGNGAAVTGPGGTSIKLWGPNAIWGLIVIGVIGGAGWMSYSNQKQLRDEIATTRQDNAQHQIANRFQLEMLRIENELRNRELERSFYVLSCTLQYPVEGRRAMATASSVEALTQFCPWIPAAPSRAEIRREWQNFLKPPPPAAQ